MKNSLHQQFSDAVLYVLRWLDLTGKERSCILCPDGPQLANGEILSETREGSGIMRGRLLSGKSIELAFTQVLMVERYKVETFNGQTTRSQEVSGDQLERILDTATVKDTGEVQVRTIEEVGNSDNRVTARRAEL